MKITNKTELYLTASSMPSNFGVTVYNELFQKYNLNKLYLARNITDATKLVETLKFLDVKGCSVSMPLKSAIIPLLDEVEETARILNSVNTVVNENGVLKGYNTDYYGFFKSIQPLEVNSVLIYGYGSVTDALVLALKNKGVKRIYLTGRDLIKAKVKANAMGVGFYQEEKIDLFVNASPMSLDPLTKRVQDILANVTMIFDLIVKKETTLKLYASEQKQEFIPGFEMYRYQFLKQFEHYTGHCASMDEVETIIKSHNLI